MSRSLTKPRGKFGTAPLFLTAISTILGAILFLRFGYAVGHLGFIGTVGVIVLGHLVTLPTALAIAEIATNQRVEGGGEYFIISRTFGLLVGSTIGVALYMSQAVSVAFYIIAFGEAFSPLFEYTREYLGVELSNKRLVTLPTLGLLALLMLTKGADVGVKLLYLVVATLFVSLACFFLGSPVPDATSDASSLLATVNNPDSFFLVFAICFPAFTGMTAGVGLSGDLRDPRRSIPLGTLSATVCGMVVYVLVAWKLSVSASPEDLAADQLIMSRIATWGPIIPIGLAAASLSSALGSILVAPRTLQAIAVDGIFPDSVNAWLAKGRPGNNEPVRASIVTSLVALTFVAIGDVDFVAQIISTFFMVTYGSLCLISFLEHFAADPSYRPMFRSRWYISLFGAAMCLWLMISMSAFYAALALALMTVGYLVISYHNPDHRGLANIFLDAAFQITRRLQIFLQQSQRRTEEDSWRPSVVCISSSSFERKGAFDLLRWISHRYGFGTYIHFIEGYLSKTTHAESKEMLSRLVRMADASDGNVYVDTLVSPSYTSAISQLIQLPGVSGKENNMILLEYSKAAPDEVDDIIDNYQLIAATDSNICILASSQRGFGYRREMHIWLTASDYENAGLMILLAYVILGHPDWKHGVIKIFAIFPAAEREVEEQRILDLIESGRLPISAQNVEFVSFEEGTDRKAIIGRKSIDADLTIVGFHGSLLKRNKRKMFEGFDQVNNVLFVSTMHEVELVTDEESPKSLSEPGKNADKSAAADAAKAPRAAEILAARQAASSKSAAAKGVPPKPDAAKPDAAKPDAAKSDGPASDAAEAPPKPATDEPAGSEPDNAAG